MIHWNRALFYFIMLEVSDAKSTKWIHTNRIAGRNRDHRDPDRSAAPSGAEDPRGGQSNEVQQQPETARAGRTQLSRRKRQVSTWLYPGPDPAAERSVPRPLRFLLPAPVH